jgi:hypothetical protein
MGLLQTRCLHIRSKNRNVKDYAAELPEK